MDSLERSMEFRTTSSVANMRKDQLELNRRKSAMLEIDYKRGLELPTIRWVITEGDLIRHRQERELNRLYRDAYLAWDNFYSGDQSATMVFRRFPALSVPEYELDILVKALLGFPQPMGYKQGNHCAILDDSWTVNLRSTEKENIMMEEFLKGFAGKSEELKKAWEGKQVVGVDVSEELKDLYKVYTDAEEHLITKEKQALETVTAQMKRYIAAQEERQKVSQKLNALKHKLAQGQPCQGCGEDEDEDEGDDE